MNYFSKSKVFLLFLLSFISGIAIRSFYVLPIFYDYITFIMGLVLISIFWKNLRIKVIGFCLLFFIAGLLRFGLNELSINYNTINSTVGKEIEFMGVVYEEPESGDDNQKIKIIGDESIQKEKVLITADLYPEFHYGDRLNILGDLERPKKFDDFDYPSYLKKFKIYLVSYKPKIRLVSSGRGLWFFNGLNKIKRKFSDLVKSSVKEPEASIFQAMALGIKKGMPKNIKEEFSKTGVSHIIAISGLHITIIGGILMNIALGIHFSRKQAFWLASLGLLFFILLVGMPASALRAGIMGFLVLLAMYLGRLNHSLNAFVLAGSIMLLINPYYLRYDIGFQLSFLAVLGLIYIGPIFDKLFFKIPEFINIKSTVMMTLSAQVFTLPLIVFYFERFSWVAPVANVLVLPVLPFILIFGFLAVFGSLIFFSLGQILFWPCFLLLKYLTSIIGFLSGFSWSYSDIKQFDYFLILIIYIILFIFLKIVRKPIFNK